MFFIIWTSQAAKAMPLLFKYIFNNYINKLSDWLVAVLAHFDWVVSQHFSANRTSKAMHP